VTTASIRRTILLVGLPFLVVVAYRDLGEVDSPPWWALGPAFALSLAGLWCSARAWDVVLPDSIDRRVADDSFYTSQLAKYSPIGAAAQALSQSALATGDELSAAKAATAMLVSKLAVVVAGGAFGPLLALSHPDLSGWLRVLLCLTPLSFALGHHHVLRWAVSLTARVLRKDTDHTILPPARAVWRSVGWSIALLALAGGSYAVLASAAGLDANPVQAAAGFVLAFVVGYLVVPVPGGLGVREAAIAVLVSGQPGAKLVAAVLLRVVVIAAEVLMAGVVRLRSRTLGRTSTP
jgi:uncharacterized membrane protein YbhN (UPF0104 family)